MMFDATGDLNDGVTETGAPETGYPGAAVVLWGGHADYGGFNAWGTNIHGLIKRVRYF
jgi:hypothetical protein